MKSLKQSKLSYNKPCKIYAKPQKFNDRCVDSLKASSNQEPDSLIYAKDSKITTGNLHLKKD